MSELQNQLKNQSLDELLSSSLKEVAGVVFPDERADMDLTTFSSIVKHWRGVHVPAYGQSIPGSFAVVTVDGSETILSPSTNQVARIQTLTLTNAGGAAPIAIQIKTGTAIILIADIGPAETQVMALIDTIFIDKNIPLSILVTGGAATDLTTDCVYSLTSQ